MVYILLYFRLSNVPPAIRVTRNNTMKIKNNIFAIPAAPAAIPVKPNSAATIATTKKINVQRNIVFKFKWLDNNYTLCI